MADYAAEIDKFLADLISRTRSLGRPVEIRNDGLPQDEQTKQMYILRHLEAEKLVELLHPAEYPTTSAIVTPKGFEHSGQTTQKAPVGLLLSWSGHRSLAVAEALRDFLPQVCQGMSVWVSSRDLLAGERWANTLAEKLERTHLGVLCLTPENLDAPWILFEAGALSKSVQAGKVIPYLIGLKPSDLRYPLAQFQAVQANHAGTRSLVDSIKGSALVDGSFDALWPQFESRLSAIQLDQPGVHAGTSGPSLSPEARELLLKASRDASGYVMKFLTKDSGLSVKTQEENLIFSRDPQVEAKWERAVDQLVGSGFLKGRGAKGETFKMTADGYDAARVLVDRLKTERPVDQVLNGGFLEKKRVEPVGLPTTASHFRVVPVFEWFLNGLKIEESIGRRLRDELDMVSEQIGDGRFRYHLPSNAPPVDPSSG